MLTHLSVRNFSLIDHIEIDFKEGFTVITGETGAGKSILLGALSLILGERMKHDVQRDADKKCIVEGTFDLSRFQMQELFEKANFDYEPITVFRREITPYGKSRNFINDTPTTLEVMGKIGAQLIDIHAQHQSLKINEGAFQLELLDGLSSNQLLLEEYRRNYNRYREFERQLSEKKEYLEEGRKKKDFLQFQWDEINTLALKEGELEALEEEQQFFANSEEILNHFGHIQHLLSEGEGNLREQVAAAKQHIDAVKAYLEQMNEVSQRFESLSIELDDLQREIESYAENYQYDPERHTLVEERLAEIHRLQQKHQLQQADQLLELRQDLEKELDQINLADDEIAQLEGQVQKLYEQLKEQAQQISKNREGAIKPFEQEVKARLINLGIANASFSVDHRKTEEITFNGIDAFEFLFSANKGVAPQKIASVASGGEISRLMLAIKGILAQHKQMPSIIFDEIDTGVSGEIADKMGVILEQLAKSCQVFSITHLPQIAAKGSNHIMVYKEEEEGSTNTRLKQLNDDERITEMAKMLSGEKMSEAAINNARELLSM